MSDAPNTPPSEQPRGGDTVQQGHPKLDASSSPSRDAGKTTGEQATQQASPESARQPSTQPGRSDVTSTRTPKPDSITHFRTAPTTRAEEREQERRLSEGKGTPQEALAWFQSHGRPELTGLPHWDSTHGWIFPQQTGTGSDKTPPAKETAGARDRAGPPQPGRPAAGDEGKGGRTDHRPHPILAAEIPQPKGEPGRPTPARQERPGITGSGRRSDATDIRVRPKEAHLARPGVSGATLYWDRGKWVVIPEPATTLAEDPLLKDLAAKAQASTKPGDYDGLRDNLNKLVKEQLSPGAPKNPLQDHYELHGNRIFFKDGPYKGQALHYAHSVGQQVGDRAGADPALKTDLRNIQPVGEEFHLRGGEGNLGHHEEWNTRYGRDNTPEANKGLQAAGRDAAAEHPSAAPHVESGGAMAKAGNLLERLAGKVAPLAIVGDVLLIHQIAKELHWITGGYDKDDKLPIGSTYHDFFGNEWKKVHPGIWHNMNAPKIPEA